MILLGNRVFADDQVKMSSLDWGLIYYDCVFIKGGNSDTEINMHRGKTIHKPKNTWGPQKLGERPTKGPPYQPSERTNPADLDLISSLQNGESTSFYCSINKWIDKENVVCLPNEILFRLKD